MAFVEFRVVTEFNVVKVKVTEEGERRKSRLLSEKRCLGCERKLIEGERTRCGQCDTCYPATLKKVKQHAISRKDLIANGELLPAGKGGRKPSNDYTKRLSENN